VKLRKLINIKNIVKDNCYKSNLSLIAKDNILIVLFYHRQFYFIGIFQLFSDSYLKYLSY